MSDNQDQRSEVERLDELKAELSRHFGRFTRWRALTLPGARAGGLGVGERVEFDGHSNLAYVTTSKNMML